MARELSFNLNPFSYEGAGKSWEILAKNAEQSANAKRIDTNRHISESKAALNRTQSYLNQANTTRQKAANIGNQAVSMLNASMDRVDAAARGKANADIRSSMEISNALASVGNYVLKSEVEADAYRGQYDGMKDEKELRKRVVTDPQGVAEEIEAMMEAHLQDPNDPYMKNYVRNFTSLYKEAKGEQESQRLDTVAKNYLTLAREQEYKIPDSEKKAYSKNNDIPMGTLKNVEFMGFSNDFADKIRKATTIEERDSILKDYEEMLSKNYDNDYFLKSKNEANQKVISKGLNTVKEAVRESDKFFDMQAEVDASAILTSWTDTKQQGMSPEGLLPAYKRLYGDKPLVFRKKVNEAVEAYQTHLKNVEFFNVVDVSKPRPNKYAVTDNWVKDEDLKYEILYQGADAYTTGDINKITGIMTYNEPKVLEDLGKYIYNDFNSAQDAKSMGEAMGRFMLIAKSPSGAAGLRKTLSDKQVSDMLTIHALTTVYGGDVQKARNLFNSKAEASVKVPMNKDLKTKVFEREKTLGPNYSKYLSVIQTINDIDPKAAIVAEPEVATMFSKLIEEKDTNEGTVQVNSVGGPDPITPQTTADPETARSLVVKKGNELYGEGTFTLETTPNGMYIYKDKFGSIMDVYNPSSVIQQVDKHTFMQDQEKVTDIPIGEIVTTETAKAVRNVGQAFEEMGVGLKNLDPEVYNYLENTFNTLISPFTNAWDVASELQDEAEKKEATKYDKYKI